MMRYTQLAFVTALVVSCAGMLPAQAAETDYSMEVKGTGFEPQKLEVPAGQKIHLTVKNTGKDEAEFESYPLNQEHKIESGESADMYIGPLEPGEYEVFDDNNPDNKGSLIAK